MKVTKLIDEEKSKGLARIEFARDIKKGLLSSPKKISSKYFYNEVGSKIFQQITSLDEYYLTRTELQILENIKDDLARKIGPEIDIVELGVGDGHKTRVLIESFLKQNVKVHFYPIDISIEAIHQLQKNMHGLEAVETHAVVADYVEGLKFVRNISQNRQIVLFLGSNIGNFNREEEEQFLKTIKTAMHKEDFLLIGFDLKKNIEMMTRAYSDSQGVTAEFNLNLLDRINHELGGNFKRENFRHLALYNPLLGAMESYLLSLTDQDVTITELEQTFHFKAFEPIHLEYSFKFLEEDISELSVKGGFTQVSNFKDPNNYYVDSLWQV